MSSAYRAVCKSILRNNNEPSTADYCCMCLKEIEENAVQIHDEVVLDSYVGSVTEQMSKILLFVVGDDVSQIMSVLEYICQQCTNSAIYCYKFLNMCRDNCEQFADAVENLTSCFDNTADDIYDFKSIYVSVDTTKLTIQQFYDSIRQENPNETALPRFKVITDEKHMNATPVNKINSQMENDKTRIRDCSTIFIKTKELIHDPTKPTEFKCKMCLKVYPTSGSLRQHFFSYHFKKDYKCTECPKSFGTAGLLHSHKMHSHIYVSCSECGRQLLNRTSTIKRHAMTHRRKMGKICNRCGKTYTKTKDYNRHMERDTCVQPSRIPGRFVCDYCGKECHFKHQLLAHIKYEHLDEKGHVCIWCSKKCYSQSALKTHILKHTRERNFICSECGGKFVTRQSLLNHVRLHTGERPYPCEFCKQGFLSASRRRDHVTRHHVRIVFSCDLCDAKYNAKRSLVQHRKRHFLANA